MAKQPLWLNHASPAAPEARVRGQLCGSGQSGKWSHRFAGKCSWETLTYSSSQALVLTKEEAEAHNPGDGSIDLANFTWKGHGSYAYLTVNEAMMVPTIHMTTALIASSGCSNNGPTRPRSIGHLTKSRAV
ncbi:hypothetical protein J6590_052659 [Homalodisca vitripennis]|nr:hypothetical protein J6590_052659 [Homalodisca vitripennis]